MIRKQQGFSFLEMLISFGILATAIVGVVGMQAVAKKGSFDAMQRALATALANDIVQRMRVNAEGVSNGSYTGTYSSFSASSSINRCQSTTTPCTSAQIAANDLYEWKMALFGADVTQTSGNVGGLTSPIGCISHAAGVVSVVVSWSGRFETSDSADTKVNGTLAASCGTASERRRQVYIDTFIF